MPGSGLGSVFTGTARLRLKGNYNTVCTDEHNKQKISGGGGGNRSIFLDSNGVLRIFHWGKTEWPKI